MHLNAKKMEHLTKHGVPPYKPPLENYWEFTVRYITNSSVHLMDKNMA